MHSMKGHQLIYLGWFMLTVLSVQSCDPARVMVVKTADKPNLSVAIYANKNILPGKEGNDKIVINIPSQGMPAKRDTTFYYGLGGWGRGDMSWFAKDIDSIIIINSNGKLLLNDEAAIAGYLNKHKHGFGHRILTIKAQ